MPSIADLFGVNPNEIDPEAAAAEGDFDIDKMLSEADRIMEAHNPTEPGAEPEPEPVVDVPRETPAPEPTPQVAAVAPDPLSELPPERRAAMLSLDQILTTDPAKRDAVLRVLAGEPEPTPEPEPQLPEEIDPNSFEARMYLENLETRKAVNQIAQRMASQEQVTQAQTAADHARAAAASFSAKHPELEQEDVYEIARYAGNSGVAGAFVEANRAQPVAQLEQAFESVLYGNEVFRSKVIPKAEAVVPGEAPEAVERKRRLTALSSGASPVAGGSTTPPQLESRPDGRLTPASRQQAVAQVAADLLRQRKGF